MQIEIRQEKPSDYRKVEEITREAFWGFLQPESDEHYLAHVIRKSPDYIPELDFVALTGGEIIGNILYTKSKILCNDGREIPTINFGPLSVLPEYQHKGVGLTLLRHSIHEAIRLGYTAILFFGHPDYYPKAGFVPASTYDIRTSKGQSFDAFMAMPLQKGALDNASGRYYESEVFEINPKDAKAFDKSFPRKPKIPFLTAEGLIKTLPAKAASTLKTKKVKYLADLIRYSTNELTQFPNIGPAEIKTINRFLKAAGYPPKNVT